SGVLGEDRAYPAEGRAIVLLGVEHRLLEQAGEHFLVGAIQRLARRGELLGDRLAVLAAADHRLQAAHLALDAGQTLEHGVLVGWGAVTHSGYPGFAAG